MRVVLASQSPQRRALLEGLGVEFEVAEPRVTELTEGDPREMVLENARWKAASIAPMEPPGTLVIAGDTEVALDGAALGQPVDPDEAREHLERLSGREHEVLGAVALMGPESGEDGLARARQGVLASTVRFHELSQALLEAYLASGEWEGRAGSYAIQGLGSALVAEVRGDVSNVIGLPVGLLLELAPELVPRS
ncbi:MAG: septum formation protein Maf [Actinobacteria bacterium]|nr:septum formation protein Maf [Actinomycetota bacterium]